jgi:hypothetical protein
MLGLVIVLFAGETVGHRGALPLQRLSPLEMWMLVALVGMLVGILLAWRWEITGGSIAVASGLAYMALESMAADELRIGLFPALFVMAGSLFVVCRWTCPQA